MGFPNNNLNQTCVYWPSPVPDGYGGFTWGEPEELDCRWVQTTEVITDRQGQQIVCRATVQVNKVLDENGMLFLGTLNDLDSDESDNPEEVSGAWQIKRFDNTPTMSGRDFFRIAYL